MSPSRFSKDKKREVTPYREEAPPASIVPMRPTTPHPDRQPSPMTDRPVTPAPPEWTSYDAPINFTWVIPDELCGMGWPKSRDQVRFLVEQGIDHLVSLSPEKIPPHYAFPNLKHTLIPVEDFTGPTIAEIQKFIEITDDARREGEAVGVHCAEGRGRTGVMCACYLIYYYEMEPWDAIRIMRRQRPGSVERKVQEETVVRFYNLLQDYGKSSVEKLEQREKEFMETQRKQQAELIRRDGIIAQQATMNLLNHMHSFHSRQSHEAKKERITRIRRAKSMPKMENEEEMNAAKLKNHIQSLLQGDKPKRSKSQLRRTDEEDASDNDRRSRAATPGRSLLEEVSLKPVGERNIKGRLDPPAEPEEKCELKNHFRDFMRTPALVKRGRSFSQPRDKEKGTDKVASESESLSRKESFEHKYVQDRMEQEKNELLNHTQRFLKRKSLINPNKTSDESDTDSAPRDKPVEKDNRDVTPSDNDVDDNANNVVANKPPPCKAPVDGKTQRRVRSKANNGDGNGDRPTRRFDRRIRSKSDVTVPKIYDMNGGDADELVENAGHDDSQAHVNGYAEDANKAEDEVMNASNGTNENANDDIGSSNTNMVDSQRIRKNNLNSNNEYVYVSTTLKVGNSNPKPFVASPVEEKERPSFSATFSRQISNESKEKREKSKDDDRNSTDSYSSTADIMNACKSGLRRLTYRKTYSRSRSNQDNNDQDNNNNNDKSERQDNDAYSGTAYTQTLSGTRLPNRPTTPGPYLNLDRNLTAGLYSVKRPTTPGPFTRDSWKRTNQKFNYSKILNCSGRETFV